MILYFLKFIVIPLIVVFLIVFWIVNRWFKFRLKWPNLENHLIDIEKAKLKIKIYLKVEDLILAIMLMEQQNQQHTII